MCSILRKDAKDLNLRFGDIVIDSTVVHPKAKLGLPEASEFLDSRFALPAGFVAKMGFDGCENSGPIDRPERAHVFNSLWREHDFIRHSGQNMARFSSSVKNESHESVIAGFLVFYSPFERGILESSTKAAARRVSSCQLEVRRISEVISEEPTPRAAQPAAKNSAAFFKSTPPVGTMRR